MPSISPSRLIPGVFVLCCAMACADNNYISEPASSQLPDGTSAAVLTGQAGMYDYQHGVMYYLDLGTQHLTSSNGASLYLDEELTVLVAEEFRATSAADAGFADMVVAANEATWNGCGYGGTCNELRADLERPSERPVPRRPAPPEMLMRRDRASRSLPGLKQRRLLPYSAIYGDPTDICTDIVNSVLPKVTTYYFNRDNGIGQVLIDAAGGAITSITKTSDLGVTLLGHLTGMRYGRVQASILGWMWNEYNCGHRQVTAGPLIVTGNYAATAVGLGWHLVCHPEPWSISFNGGGDWHSITVSVCHYEN